MPIYEIYNPVTGETTSDYFTSYDEFQKYMESRPDLEQSFKINLGTGARSSSIKTDEGFKDLLKTIKKTNKGSTMDV